MFKPGEQLAPEVMFAFRMMMLKYELTPADVMRILVSLEKEKPPLEGGGLAGAG